MYSDDELFDVLTESGETTGQRKRRGDIHRDGDWHASVHIWAARRRLDGMELLLQKRADSKDSYPGCFDAASTGHIDAGEDAISAAIRELPRADAKTVPIVAMTANVFIEDIRKAEECGMNGHIAKPLEIPVLVGTLVKYFGDKKRKAD